MRRHVYKPKPGTFFPEPRTLSPQNPNSPKERTKSLLKAWQTSRSGWARRTCSRKSVWRQRLGPIQQSAQVCFLPLLARVHSLGCYYVLLFSFLLLGNSFPPPAQLTGSSCSDDTLRQVQIQEASLGLSRECCCHCS